MRRNTNRLANENFDLLIIGGGIYGVTAAWDAAQRGLSVAIVDQADFAACTTANSLKIVHGGLRYLQSLDIKRMRESVYERKVFLRIAPHLVQPLRCIMPTYGHLLKGPEIMTIALLLNDLISFDRNWGMEEQKFLQCSKVINRKEATRLLPGYQHPKFNGGATWYDAQMLNSERLALSFLHSAAEVGACAANYVKVKNLLLKGKQVTGARVTDLFTGDEFDIRARLVINNCGPQVDQVLKSLGRNNARTSSFLPSTAINLITRQFIDGIASGLRGKFEFTEQDGRRTRGHRVYFIAPWRGLSIVGTQHRPFWGDISNFKVTEEHVTELLAGINDAYPGARLQFDDVKFVMAGFLPMDPSRKPGMDVRLKKHYSIIDHGVTDGIDGLITVVGVKYTTARDVSEKTIDLAYRKLGKNLIPSQTQELPLYGGQDNFGEFIRTESQKRPFQLDERTIMHLIGCYGSAYPEVIKYIDGAPHFAHKIDPSLPNIYAELIFGLRDEMALTLSDLILRRTGIGAVGYPGADILTRIADLAAEELGWNPARKQEEILKIKQVYAPMLN